MKLRLAVLAALAGLLSLAAFAQEPAGSPAPDLGDAARGKKVFLSRCAACHGADARGSAAFAKQVGAYSPQSLDLTSERVQSLDDAALAERIQHGHGKMKGFNGKLSSRQISDLVSYLRLIGKRRG